MEINTGILRDKKVIIIEVSKTNWGSFFQKSVGLLQQILMRNFESIFTSSHLPVLLSFAYTPNSVFKR